LSDPIPFETKRLILRRFTARDAEAFLAYRNDPRIAQYQSWEGCTAEEATEFVHRQATRQFGVPGEWLQIAVALKESDQLIGDCAVRIHPQEPRQATIGVTFAQAYQKRGYAVEALSGLLDCLFARAKLHRVVADTDPKNTAAWRLMERLGLRREGHLHQSLWFKGDWADEFLYAILREEWMAKRTAFGAATDGS
jgi:RimJ/RimL family protein N-acetyltransferase